MSAAENHPGAAIADPEWVLRMYREAKELVCDLREAHLDELTLPPDLKDRVEEFWAATFMDECTTFSLDCGCEKPASGPDEAAA